MKTFYNLKTHGKKEYEIYRKTYKKIMFSLIYSLFAAYCITIMNNIKESSYFIVVLLILISLWRIYVINLPVVIFCEKVLLILQSRENLSVFPKYEEVLYDEVAGVSFSWKDLYLGKRLDGCLVKFPVLLNKISKEDKNKFQELIKNKKLIKG